MSAPMIVPFNFQPSGATSRKTSSYTVPAGKYARAVLSFYNTRIVSGSLTSITASPYYITVDGVNVLTESKVGFNTTRTNNQTCYVTISPSAPVVACCSDPSFIAINGYSVGTGTLQFTGIGASSIQIGSSANGSGFVTGFATFSEHTFVEVWLQPGQVISATGGNWQAIVTEYNALS